MASEFSASLPEYQEDDAPPEWAAPPEYTGLNLTRHNTGDRISFREGIEDALTTKNHNKITGRLDHIIAGHLNSDNIATLERWKSELIEYLKGPDTDPDFNYYTCSNAFKVIEKLDGLIHLRVASSHPIYRYAGADSRDCTSPDPCSFH